MQRYSGEVKQYFIHIPDHYMRLVAPVEKIVYCFLMLLSTISISSCEKEMAGEMCIKGKVIGQGCLTGAYAIKLEGRNSDYGIAENLSYDNVVETLNLPDEYKLNGTVIYFTFTKPAEEIGKYLTYCASAPQIVLRNVAAIPCSPSMHPHTMPEAGY
jgi:hypothetical protein